MSDQQSDRRNVVAPPDRAASRPMRELERLDDLLTNNAFRAAIARAVPNTLSPARVLSTFAGCIRRTPLLRECNILDIAGKVLAVSNVGLELDTPMQQAHLIPFKETRRRQINGKWTEEEYVNAQVIFGYRGLLNLVYRSGLVSAVRSEVVWKDEVENGAFAYEYGTSQFLRHQQTQREPKFDPISQSQGVAEYPVYAYSCATMTNGNTVSFEVMPWSRIRAIRDNAPAYRSARFMMEKAKTEGWRLPAGWMKAPWVERLPAMASKTVFRHHANWLPQSVELASALTIDAISEQRSVDFGPIVDIGGGDYAEAAVDAMGESGDPAAAFGDRREPDGVGTQQQSETKDAPVRQQSETSAAPDRQQRQPAPRKTAAKKAAASPQDDGPPDDGRWGPPAGDPVNSAPATSEAAPRSQVATPAAEEESANPASAAEASSFEEWLLNFSGDPVGDEPFSDPVLFARAAVIEWDKTLPPERDAWQDHNGGAIENARQASAEAAHVFDAAWSTDVQEEPPGVTVVELKMDRGKPSAGPYLKDCKVAIEALVRENFLDWIDLNRSTMARVAASTISLVLKALVEKSTAIGVPLPPDLGPSLLGPKPAPTAGVPTEPAGSTGSPRAEAVAANPGGGSAPSPGPAAPMEDQDWKSARLRARDLDDCRDIHELNAMLNGIILKNFGERMTREGKTEIIAFVKDAADRARARVGTPA